MVRVNVRVMVRGSVRFRVRVSVSVRVKVSVRVRAITPDMFLFSWAADFIRKMFRLLR